MEEESTKRSPSPSDGDVKQERERSLSPAQQTESQEPQERTNDEESTRESSPQADRKDGASSPPAPTDDRSSPLTQQSSPAPNDRASEEREAVGSRRSSTEKLPEEEAPSVEDGETGEVKSPRETMSDAADAPTLADSLEPEVKEKEEAVEEEEEEELNKPASLRDEADEARQVASPAATPLPARSPSAAPSTTEPAEEVTKATSGTKKDVDDVTLAAAESTESCAAGKADDGEQKVAAVVIDEPSHSPAAQEQSRRSRNNRSNSSSSSGSSKSSSSSDSSSAGSGHRSSNVDSAGDGGSLPKKVKLEPVEQRREEENEANEERNERIEKLRDPDGSSSGEPSILKSRMKQQQTAERPAAAKPPSQTPPSGEQSSLRSSLNSEGSVSSRTVGDLAEEEPRGVVTGEKGEQSGTPSLAPPAPSSSSVVSSRACSPSLASSSAQSTPTKEKEPTAAAVARGAKVPEVKLAKGSATVVPVVVEKPDSARLTADLQSCKRQLAEVRSKYDVTRKELHATKRKLKRMTVRLNGMAANASTVGSGANSPHVPAIAIAPAPAEEDRNRKWREPMILSAMKIKAAMGIQAYKSLIKDGELLLPSLRTITRYLESLRKAGGANGVAAAIAGAMVGAVPGGAGKTTNQSAMEVDEEEEEDEEEDDVMVAPAPAAELFDRSGHARKKHAAKAGGEGVRRTVDHNRNEQQQRHGHGVHLQDIKTEQDPVSFTASPDINYYQHNANDDEDDDEDGYQDPTSLLEQSRYDGDGGIRMNGDDAGYHHQQQYAAQQPNQQQTLSQAQIEFLKSMVGFRKKWTPYELRTCNEIRHIIGSREYDSLRKNDGMPLPSVKTLRKYRNAEPVPEEVEVVGRKRKHHEMLAEESGSAGAGGGVGGGVPPVPGAGGQHKAAEAYGAGRLFLFGNDAEKAMMKAEHDSEDGHFDVGVLTMAQISFLQTLTLNTKGFSDYELQRSLELKNELGSKNYETLRKQEFLNIPTLVMLTRYEQDNGLEDLSRMAGATVAVDDDDEPDGRGDAGSGELVNKVGQRNMVDDEEHNLELLQQKRQQEEQLEEEQRAREQQQQEQQQQLELYNRLTQADLTRHPLFDSIAGDSSPGDGSDQAATAAAMAVAMAAAAAGIHSSYDLNGTAGDDSSLGIFENHSIFDKDSPTFDMSKLSPAHVEFLNTLPENPKRWTQEMINSALDIKNEIGTRDYEILRRQGIPLPAARTLRRHKDIRNKADRAVSEPGEILPASGATAGVVGSG
ncbi:uncharacterized protein LOC131289888 [Anopheles ziemanni]|uniref:uncharacterized protein LOC131289888 n=1 Tax=Anopheles ziemanni TaxID=345580 RepID=UPI00265F30A6|nr:uncharacterized protein LOC131289888 [Anopheles ziemanni]